MDLQKVWDDMKANLSDFAIKSWKEYSNAAISDGEKFIEKRKNNLLIWGKDLVDGELSKDEFKSLILGEEDLTELTALTEAGIAKIKLKEFLDGLVNVVVATFTKLI